MILKKRVIGNGLKEIFFVKVAKKLVYTKKCFAMANRTQYLSSVQADYFLCMAKRKFN